MFEILEILALRGFELSRYLSLKISAELFIQYRKPVGFGPSGKGDQGVCHMSPETILFMP